MLVAVGERDEAGQLMLASLMHAAQRPLAGFVDATAEALPARHGYGKVSIAVLRVEGNPRPRYRLEPL